MVMYVISTSLCINRTIVELKRRWQTAGFWLLTCINRTIVELKLSSWVIPRCDEITYQSYHSGIETTSGIRGIIEEPSINRTIVELKPVIAFGNVNDIDGINRTIVELKRNVGQRDI